MFISNQQTVDIRNENFNANETDKTIQAKAMKSWKVEMMAWHTKVKW